MTEPTIEEVKKQVSEAALASESTARRDIVLERDGDGTPIKALVVYSHAGHDPVVVEVDGDPGRVSL